MLLVNKFNIGRQLGPAQGAPIQQTWNNRGCTNGWENGNPSAGGGTKFAPRVLLQQTCCQAMVQDSDRSWTGNVTNIQIAFNSDCSDASLVVGGTATGHTIALNGVNQTTLYEGGSGTGHWLLQIPAVVKATDTLTYSYNPSVGNTKNPENSQELPTITAFNVNNFTTRRLRFILYASNNAIVASTTIQFSVHQYMAGNPSTYLWMAQEMALLVTTDSTGLVDVEYTGTSVTVGGTVYVVVLQPNSSPTEALVWTETVQ